MRLAILILSIVTFDLLAFSLANETIEEFVEELKVYPQLDLLKVSNSLHNVKISKKIIGLMDRPAEKTKTWTQYRSLLVGEKRVQQGCSFLKENLKTFREAEVRYGVPSSIIAGIVGVETFYGKIKGNHDVFTALATLAFHYPKDNPKRKNFFRYQLKEFLLMADKHGRDFNSYRGSYAGALGIPQFMPDNYRRLAVDFNKDGKIDIINNVEDAIGSIGNFLRYHGWIPNEAVISVIPKSSHIKSAKIESNPSRTNTTLVELVPDWRETKFVQTGNTDGNLDSTLVALLEQSEEGDVKQWLGFENFFTLFHYNPRLFYALAVASLADALKECEI